MKVPPMDRSVILNSATKVPMRSAGWQAMQDPDRNVGPGDGKFLWDGKFVANPKVQGAWTQLGTVKSIDEFKPEGKGNKPSSSLKITFKAQGATLDGLIIWSDNMLLNLRKNEALKMTLKTIKGVDYLFIETGGFHPKHGPDWKAPLHVMKRNQG